MHADADTGQRQVLYRYRWAAAEFDEARFELRVGGVLVELQQKPLQVLALLLSRAGQLVSKDEILAEVWKHPTGDAPLANAVSKLRAALGPGHADTIVTVARQGYRCDAAPERLAVGRRLGSRLQLAPGAPVPGRENYQLASLLGSSHTNETWLARQPRTGDRRVFKFAVHAERLAELKREVTLFRVLRESLGDRPDIARVLDWNLEQPPCWLECAYGGLGLPAWAAETDADSGLPRLQATDAAGRLALALQVVDAVAAAHGAGVLHKDIKPANVLVDAAPGGGWQVQLTDFGSGRLLDPERLAELRITQLGMTLAPGTDASSGTPYYLAPELGRGEPPSMRSDVYALGVMLYQLLVGDLQRLLAPGWERDIADPLLCEDIARATDVDPGHRLATAAELAQRLRALPQRRQRREAEAAAAAAATQAQAALARARARRPWAVAAALLLLAGTGTSLWLYGAERRASAALSRQVAVAEALNRLLRDDLVAAANPAAPGGKADITVADALAQAAGRVDQRFGGEGPAVRAGLHAAMQDALSNLSRAADAVAAGTRAVQALEAAGGSDRRPLQQARLRLAVDLVQLSRLDEAAAVVRAIEADPAAPAQQDAVFRAQLLYAKSWLTGGELALQTSLGQLQQALELVQPYTEAQAPGRERIMFALADNYALLGRGDEAVALYRRLLAAQEATYGPSHRRTQVTRMGLGTALALQGRDDEAHALLEQALQALSREFGPGHRLALNARDGLARVLLHQHRHAEAAEQWAQVRQGYAALMGEDSSYTLTALTNQAMALHQGGRPALAVPLLRQALQHARVHLKDDAPQVQQIRYALADALLDQRQGAEAAPLLQGLDAQALNLAQQQPDWPARLALAQSRLARRP